MDAVDGELGGEAGDGFEFVEGAASDAEAATGDHGDPEAVAGEEGGEDEGGFVADAAGAVFVDAGWGVGGPGEDTTGVEHGVGEGADFFRGHATEEDGHSEGAHLVVGHVAGGEGADEVVDLVGGEGVAFAFAFDEGGDVHLGQDLQDFFGINRMIAGDEERGGNTICAKSDGMVAFGACVCGAGGVAGGEGGWGAVFGKVGGHRWDAGEAGV